MNTDVLNALAQKMLDGQQKLHLAADSPFWDFVYQRENEVVADKAKELQRQLKIFCDAFNVPRSTRLLMVVPVPGSECKEYKVYTPALYLLDGKPVVRVGSDSYIPFAPISFRKDGDALYKGRWDKSVRSGGWTDILYRIVHNEGGVFSNTTLRVPFDSGELNPKQPEYDQLIQNILFHLEEEDYSDLLAPVNIPYPLTELELGIEYKVLDTVHQERFDTYKLKLARDGKTVGWFKSNSQLKNLLAAGLDGFSIIPLEHEPVTVAGKEYTKVNLDVVFPPADKTMMDQLMDDLF